MDEITYISNINLKSQSHFDWAIVAKLNILQPGPTCDLYILYILKR